ncbi:PQ-loop repeat family protein / transmembrane family protein [Rhynchospora pubera]|uniref:PQ-loop repeat family protein / transmembrane family protein n=1 Tax=Rhynchospora pubera TaxID=906938 RepID=A0AAV8FEH6_9POAL|nr:PQ-loop repeat family protein / transmembrane family protein [Rhynchospora pubera]
MGFHHSSRAPICSSKGCSEWARVYLKYCLCSTRDGVALTLGLLSVVSWGVAEAPQIMTNYKSKSTEGLSMAFLTTWLVGDLFNLIGCFLEPATLPTQFYMALLYTATTLVLAWQTIYYGHLYHRVKSNKSEKHKSQQEVGGVSNESKTDNEVTRNDSENSESGRSSPIPVAVQRYSGDGVDFYYTSARSLSRSPLPMAGSWVTHSRKTPPLINDLNLNEPLLGEHMQSAPVTKNMLSIIPVAFYLVSTFILWSSTKSSTTQSSDGMVIPVGRKLLQLEGIMVNSGGGGGESWIGTFLGWAMAVIYMGGRLPQIYLNIKRGNVEGLSPLMFTFALVGNATYVGSILVNSLEWSKIRPNLPWLVDAAGCVVLDSFIILQFLYFHFRSRTDTQDTEK